MLHICEPLIVNVYSDSILTLFQFPPIPQFVPQSQSFPHCHGLHIVSKTYLSQQKNKQMSSVTTLVCITVSDKVCREHYVCVCVCLSYIHNPWILLKEEVGELK